MSCGAIQKVKRIEPGVFSLRFVVQKDFERHVCALTTFVATNGNNPEPRARPHHIENAYSRQMGANILLADLRRKSGHRQMGTDQRPACVAIVEFKNIAVVLKDEFAAGEVGIGRQSVDVGCLDAVALPEGEGDNQRECGRDEKPFHGANETKRSMVGDGFQRFNKAIEPEWTGAR